MMLTRRLITLASRLSTTVTDSSTEYFHNRRNPHRCLGAFSLDVVRSHVRRYSVEEEPELEFVGNIDEDRIRLTDRGRNIFEGLQMNSPD